MIDVVKSHAISQGKMMMDAPRQRQTQILEWLRTDRMLATDALAARLGVSLMTIHRDLDQLVKHGHAQKIYGGVQLLEPQADAVEAQTCAVCRMTVPERTAFTVQLANGEQRQACCAHCGLLLLSDTPTVNLALTRDFLYGRMVNVMQAVYILESRVHLCCVPGVLCFATHADAEDFARGFGGRVLSYAEARTELSAQHHPNSE